MLTSLSEAQTMSEIEIVPFKENLLKFDEIERNQKRTIHTIRDTRSYFWHNYKLNKKKFDRLFTGLLAQRFRNPTFNLHGSVLGSMPQKHFIELPTELCPYKARTTDSMFFALWSVQYCDKISEATN